MNREVYTVYRAMQEDTGMIEKCIPYHAMQGDTGKEKCTLYRVIQGDKRIEKCTLHREMQGYGMNREVLQE